MGLLLKNVKQLLLKHLLPLKNSSCIKIFDEMFQDLRGDLCLVASALKKVQEKDTEIDTELIANYLSRGQFIVPQGYRERAI